MLQLAKMAHHMPKVTFKGSITGSQYTQSYPLFMQHTPISIETLHAWLGHLSWSTLQLLLDSINPTHWRTLSTYEGCLLGKSMQRIFKPSTHCCTQPFELIHMDLAGPMKTRSIQGSFYHFIIIDDYTCYKWALFLLQKSDTFEAFKNFHTLISTFYKGTLRAAHSNHEGEFLSQEFIQHMKELLSC